ncbi:MAG TPA: TfoX/Sxy family protein [Dehalococcoidia bacterium]|nr:TfoX/Sxy family protein [Dehalococcoidia bacterium]
MAYNQELADRVRSILSANPGLAEKKMFGGLSFLLRGNMCCGVLGDDLIVRLGPEDHAQALAQPHARPMDFTGRPMRGFVYVGREGWRSDDDLARWLQRGVDLAASLPPK